MNTEIIKTDGQAVEYEALMRAADMIRQGGLVVFPTETVYGLGGDGTNAEAAKRIYAAKGRPSDNPLIIHVATPEQAEDMAAAIRATVAELVGQDAADAMRILYGGSMKPSNVDSFMACPDVDGGLIGGAALKAEDFIALIDAASK